MRSDGDEGSEWVRSVNRGISKSLALLSCFYPHTHLPSTMSIPTPAISTPHLNPWSNAFNEQWDKWQSPLAGHRSIHHTLKVKPMQHPIGWHAPTPHVMRERATTHRAQDDSFADASFRDRMWATSIGLDTKMDTFRTHPQQYQDVQLYQWLIDSLYDLKDQPFMNTLERLSQRYTVNGVRLVYDHVVELQRRVTSTRLLEVTTLTTSL